ncbi:unnamed protein product [Arabidopsis halleri]
MNGSDLNHDAWNHRRGHGGDRLHIVENDRDSNLESRSRSSRWLLENLSLSMAEFRV